MEAIRQSFCACGHLPSLSLSSLSFPCLPVLCLRLPWSRGQNGKRKTHNTPVHFLSASTLRASAPIAFGLSPSPPLSCGVLSEPPPLILRLQMSQCILCHGGTKRKAGGPLAKWCALCLLSRTGTHGVVERNLCLSCHANARVRPPTSPPPLLHCLDVYRVGWGECLSCGVGGSIAPSGEVEGSLYLVGWRGEV